MNARTRGTRGALTIGALVVAAACSTRVTSESHGTAASPDTAGVLVETVSINAPIELPSQLYVEHDAAIVARSAGVVESVFVDLGASVTVGAPLARLENTDQELAASQAEATYDNAGRLAARARAMTKAGGVTVADSEQVEFQYRQADIARRKARRDLELTRIASPFTGVVSARSARASRFVSVGDTLFRVTEAGPLLARVRVPESGGAGVRVGDRATVVGVSGSTVAASVLRTAPAYDAASGTREVVLRLTPTTAFLPGASVMIRLGSQQRRVVAIPKDLVSPDGFVLVVESGRTALRPVTVGGDVGSGRVEVVSGLASGERVARSTGATR
jgi:RND family efflux transporter MFP subunit